MKPNFRNLSVRTRLLPVVALMAALPGGGAQTSPSPAELCETAASRAGDSFGVPRSVMLAISLAETGRREGAVLRPWPWAINFAGEGHWFASAAEAIDAALARQAEGLSNFDVGCFQINYRWHGDAFLSLDEMIDPEANARYAAQFLAQLHERHGSWDAAAAAYHSNTADLAADYRSRFEAIHDGLASSAVALAGSINRFPLLRAGAAGSRGSIVPAQSGLGRLLLGRP